MIPPSFRLIAAMMLCGNADPDPHKLHPQLLACLETVDGMCITVNGELQSRQVVALLILWWRTQNPGARPYGE
jgi:hypothetical protein